ncbi:hypothetical protein [Streptomyces sp. NPDC088115]|uniref:hypothetical protein n=1 Tax=Streptomyces sp. NPDC088115 TaxID=3365824 RepID=UPI0038292F02
MCFRTARLSFGKAAPATRTVAAGTPEPFCRIAFDTHPIQKRRPHDRNRVMGTDVTRGAE